MSRALPVLVAAALALAGCSTNESEAKQEEAQVARVGDGDSIELADGTRVRLVQIDAAELGEGECYGAEAAEALRELLPPGTSIRLEPDPRLDDVDRFGRLLRYVHLGEANVNLELVRGGAAAPWFFGGARGRYADKLLDAARAAREAGRGLWGACDGTRLAPLTGIDTGRSRQP
jgi:micrococcal nuclease